MQTPRRPSVAHQSTLVRVCCVCGAGRGMDGWRVRLTSRCVCACVCVRVYVCGVQRPRCCATSRMDRLWTGGASVSCCMR